MLTGLSVYYNMTNFHESTEVKEDNINLEDNYNSSGEVLGSIIVVVGERHCVVPKQEWWWREDDGDE